MTSQINEQPPTADLIATFASPNLVPTDAQNAAAAVLPNWEKPAETTDAADVAVANPAPDTETDASAVIPASVEKPAKTAKRHFAVSGIEGFVNSKKHGKPFAVMRTKGYPEVFAIGSPEMDARIRAQARKKGPRLKLRELQEVNDELRSQAEEHGIEVDLYPRVSPLNDGGVEIDLCDGAGTTVLITADGVEVAKGTSQTLFMRASSSLPLPYPAIKGDFSLLWKYVNLKSDAFLLYIAWITYTIARPKTESSKYVFLVLKGSQGTGKTFASKTTKGVIDPNTVNAQTLPASSRDLAIMMQLVHLLVVDNMRDLTTAISDMLCIAATGGAVPMRKLYSDDEQKALFLHGAVLFNGIHPFIGQSDFADRCLVLDLEILEPTKRKSEGAMLDEFEADRPEILKGLYDLISSILQKLTDAEVVAPSRMLDFCKWLAGMEAAMGLPVGKLQYLYAASLKDSQLESLLDNPLAVIIIAFAENMEEPEWLGTPSEFYSKLTTLAELSHQRSRVWPSSAAVLSKRLHGLQAPLMAQGISIDWTRGKDRQIVLRIPAEMCKKKESSSTDGQKSSVTQSQINLIKAGQPYRSVVDSTPQAGRIDGDIGQASDAAADGDTANPF